VADLHVYLGTYTSNGGEGIYRFALDGSTGALKRLGVQAGVVNPSFLALDASGRRLYAVNEVDAYYGKPEGALSAFRIEDGSGELSLINQQPSKGASPCHLALDRTERVLFAANYGGGSVAVFPLRADGGLDPCSHLARHEGCGPVLDRQETPHAHCVAADPSNRHVLAADLGADRIFAYALDAERGALRAAPSGGCAAAPGSGPRHLAFHPEGRWVYVVHELEDRISRYAYDGMTGALRSEEAVVSLPEGFADRNYGAGIEVDPRGRFLYVSNRGQDAIAHFRIDAGDGSLAYQGCYPTRGKFPRHFAMDPGGRFLIAANQKSDAVSVFRIDPVTGGLEDTGHGASVPSPVCVAVRDPKAPRQ
jgi:6-phosphogluconolactonase